MKTESTLSKIVMVILLLLLLCASIFITKYGWNAVVVPFLYEIGITVKEIGLGLAFVFLVIHAWLTFGFSKSDKNGWEFVVHEYVKAGFELLLLYIATLFL